MRLIFKDRYFLEVKVGYWFFWRLIYSIIKARSIGSIRRGFG